MTRAATASLSSKIGGWHPFLLRRLHSLTGIIFGGYLVVHLIINATLIQGTKGRDYFQGHVDQIHSVPFLIIVEWLFIYLPILYHAGYGIWIAFNGRWNIDRYPLMRNGLYGAQRISALILAGFILFHVLAMKGLFGSRLAFDPDHSTLSVYSHINASWAVAFLIYPVGIVASAFHTANGFWTAGITWGLTTSAGGQRRWGYVCCGIGVLLLACGLLALIASIHSASRLQDLLIPTSSR